jgi:1,4-alpha-glucan branching enzyme
MVEVDDTGKTTFRFRHKTKGPVFVVGDFCQWQTDHLPMRRVNDGEWMLMLRLPPGTYEFRYHADGQWFTDFAAFGINHNSFKEYNSVLRIPKVRPAVHEPVRIQTTSIRRLAASA